jgi:hypothetical protein
MRSTGVSQVSRKVTTVAISVAQGVRRVVVIVGEG